MIGREGWGVILWPSAGRKLTEMTGTQVFVQALVEFITKESKLGQTQSSYVGGFADTCQNRKPLNHEGRKSPLYVCSFLKFRHRRHGMDSLLCCGLAFVAICHLSSSTFAFMYFSEHRPMEVHRKLTNSICGPANLGVLV